MPSCPELLRMLGIGIFCLFVMDGALAYDPVPAPPVDESYKDPALQDFRNLLLAAVVVRDTEAVIGMASPDIHVSFGGDSGHVALRDFLQRQQGRYWAGLETALRLGGVYQIYDGEPTFWAPFIWGVSDLDNTGIDPFSAYIVIGSDVHIRALPSRQATVVGVVSHEVVVGRGLDQVEATKGTSWLAVELPNGREGWIAGRYVRPFLGLRLGFEKIGGHWVWNRALAGD